MHQRIGVDQLHRAGRAHRGARRAVHGSAGGQHQQGTQAFAAIEHGVAHGLAQAGGRVQRHPARQRVFHRRLLRFAPGNETEGV